MKCNTDGRKKRHTATRQRGFKYVRSGIRTGRGRCQVVSVDTSSNKKLDEILALLKEQEKEGI